MNPLDKLLTTISVAPENQIDKPITDKIKGLIGCSPEVVAYNLKEIRDLCVAESLCTDFAIMVLSETIRIAETK